MSRFFIDRPVFAWVIAIIIMVVGAISIVDLPVAQYPSIAAPEISIIANYPGASAKTLENTVTQVIEQKLSGIDHLRYIESASTSSGTVTITVTFDGGTNADIAQVQVQNKVALATPLLPVEVQQQGVQVTKSVKNFLMVVGLYSEDGSMSAPDLSDFMFSVLQDPISRLPGWAISRPLARSTRCASGSIRTSSRSIRSQRRTSSKQSRRKMRRSRQDRSARCRRCRGSC